MKLNKEQVCVFIENESQLQKAKELLLKYGEELSIDGSFNISTSKSYNYLQMLFKKYWHLSNISWVNDGMRIVNLEELEEILQKK